MWKASQHVVHMLSDVDISALHAVYAAYVGVAHACRWPVGVDDGADWRGEGSPPTSQCPQ